MKMKKLLALLLSTAMAVSMLAGCGTSNEDTKAPKETTASTDAGDTKATDNTDAADNTNSGDGEAVTLTIWIPENQINKGTIDSMCKSFQELHPEWNIDFTVEAQGEDTALEAIQKDVAAAGDIYFFASDQLSELVAQGAIAKLGGTTEEMVKSTMSQQVIDTVTEDGSIYAIPFTHNTFFMYYDKSLLTADEIKSVEGIMAADTESDVYNFSFDAAGGWKLAAWYYGAGNTIYGKDGSTYADGCDWNNATGLAVTNYIIDLMNNEKCAYNDDISVTELAADHRVGAWFDGSWNYNLYKEALGDDLGVAVIPTFNPDGTDYQLKSFYGSKAIGVNPQAAYPAVAVAFAAYLGSEEMQLQRLEETDQAPTNLALSDSAAVKDNEVASVIVQEAAIASVVQPSNVNFSSKYWANVGGFATEIRSGEFTKDNAQEKLNTFCDTMIVQ